ncbi:P-loop containing nucleoside triphosphate hydrolase protein [Xylariaceae sp. FL0016]|nr:P-loop containing nucleoside triphosphate hydrolase protein [Xylariaceae sp. FL0016]
MHCSSPIVTTLNAMATARYVDTVPAPDKVREKRIIVLSYSRSGTLGLCKAMEVLGYKPYNMGQVVRNGYSHIKMFQEALQASEDRQGGRYAKEDLDKWLGDYDALTIVSCYLIDEIVAAYPDAQFILTVREPETWAKSIWNTIGKLDEASTSFPLAFIKRFDKANLAFCDLVNLIFGRITGGHGRTDAGYQHAMAEFQRHNEKAKSMIPPEQLLVVKLEDGLGWEQICPFLGVDIPDTPYPRQNDPNDFKNNVMKFFEPGKRKAMGFVAGTFAAVALGLWYML